MTLTESLESTQVPHDDASLAPEFVELLTQQLGERFSLSPSILDIHGRDESCHAPRRPAAVCFAESTDDVVAIVRACADHGVPLVPFGAGTSVEGQVLPAIGAVSLDLSHMDRVLAVRVDDLDATVEAGVTRKQLNRALADLGLFFPIDPGADATLGGMAATRASGTNAVRYGTMRDAVLGLEVVMADGRVIQTSRRARKSSAGYDLTRLFVGSEGTLGVITKVTVRLHGRPTAISSAVVSFDTLGSAVKTVIEAVQLGIPVARIELLDEVMVAAINAYADLDMAERPCLMIELHGSEAAVAEQTRELGELAAENGGSDFQWATDAVERERLWQGRHHAYFAGLALRPGCRVLSTDVCVPISRLAECIVETKADIVSSGLTAPLVGHAGDGNFHLLLLFDPEDAGETERAEAFHHRLVERALAMDGTSTGEHGVGLGKRRYLRAEHGEGVDVMLSLKHALDPQGILNPGKIFPD